MTNTFEDVRKIVAEILGVDPVELEMQNRSQAMEILTRGAHNYALEKATRQVCEALAWCKRPEEWPTGHHPTCDKVRAEILGLKAK